MTKLLEKIFLTIIGGWNPITKRSPVLDNLDKELGIPLRKKYVANSKEDLK